MPDSIVRSIDRSAGVRVVSALTTALARDAARRHGVGGLGACALGQGLTASLLLATLTKGGERVTLQIRGDGPLGGLVADAKDDGGVRGYLLHPEAAAAPVAGRPRLATAIGRDGVVNVVRDLGLRERYQGQIPLTIGEIDEDVESYLRISEQVPSALGCEVLVDGPEVAAAAGVLVQSLPGDESEAREARIREVQHALRSGVLWERLRAGAATAHELAQAVYGDGLELLDEREARFQCRCSLARVADTLTLLSVVDLDEMIAEDGQAEVTCNFCNERYVVERAELEQIRATVARGPRDRN